MTRMQRVLFDALVACALAGKVCPTNGKLETLLGGGTVESPLYRLIRDGCISSETIPGRRYRQVTILVGEHAGLKTAAPVEKREIPKPTVVAEPRHYPPCEWCEKPVKSMLSGGIPCTYCSQACVRAHASTGRTSNLAQVNARLNRPPQPKGCKTVDEWLQAGGVPYTEPQEMRA